MSMKILPILNNQIQKPNFGTKPNSRKLNFTYNDFYVNIRGYGKNSEWAKIVKETADKAVDFIRSVCNFEETIKKITQGIIIANQIPLDLNKRLHSGILRITRNGWVSTSAWYGKDLITKYNNKNKYKLYEFRLDKIADEPLKNPFPEMSLTRPQKLNFGKEKYLLHSNHKSIESALKLANGLFTKFHNKYIKNKAKKEDLEDINSIIAELRWIMAHSTPWERGSDAISNILVRSMYKAAGIKTYPLKKGISLDLEAFCTELDDYKKLFETYFEKLPHLVE